MVDVCVFASTHLRQDWNDPEFALPYLDVPLKGLGRQNSRRTKHIMTKRKHNQADLHVGDAKRPRLSTRKHVDTSPTTHTSQSSTLLNLPGEIRNRIFEYALTAESQKLRMDLTKESASWLDVLDYKVPFCRDNIEFNQLKYVYRQLHYETAALELKHNTLVLSKTAGGNSMLALNSFLLRASARLPSSHGSRASISTSRRSGCRTRIF